MDILQYAENGAYWKNIIYDIISNGNFNPWDIDVGALADSYLEKVREMRMVNFEVPGTIILVGSILLKLKSDIVSSQTIIFEESLSLDDKGAVMEADDELVADLDEITGEPLPPSALEPSLLVRRIPKRAVTLAELIIFLKRVVAQAEKKDGIMRERWARKLEVQINKKDMERIMREVYRDIRRLSKGQKTTFRELVDEWKRESIVAYLIPVLHLANRNKINVEQEELYGDIFISPK